MKWVEEQVEVNLPKKEFFRIIAEVCQSEFGYNVTADNYDEFLGFCADFIREGINKFSQEMQKEADKAYTLFYKRKRGLTTRGMTTKI